jgi:hypothetical protein
MDNIFQKTQTNTHAKKTAKKFYKEEEETVVTVYTNKL